MKLDATDLRILAELQADGSLSNVELARRVHLSPSPCLARVKALEAAGVISRYVALANAAALGLGLNVFINISLKTQKQGGAGRLRAPHCRARRGDGVLPDDRRQRLPDPRGVADIGGAGAFILEQLTPIRGHREDPLVSFALKQVRYKTALPLPAKLGRPG
jgi:Lrp/AsnC family leucine-responsive transcriptional regulator